MISNLEKYIALAGRDREAILASLEADAESNGFDIDECARQRLVARAGAEEWLAEHDNAVENASQ